MQLAMENYSEPYPRDSTALGAPPIAPRVDRLRDPGIEDLGAGFGHLPVAPTQYRPVIASINRQRCRENVQKPSETM